MPPNLFGSGSAEAFVELEENTASTARFEWIIPGAYKAWANKVIYVKRRKEKYVPYTMPKRTFSFKKAGKYQLIVEITMQEGM